MDNPVHGVRTSSYVLIKAWNRVRISLRHALFWGRLGWGLHIMAAFGHRGYMASGHRMDVAWLHNIG